MATIQDRKHQRLEELSVAASRAFVESGLHGIEAEVVVALDASPRMLPLYQSGVVQDVASALLALAMKFDDDGIVPVWSFDVEAKHIGEIRRHDYSTWVKKNVPMPSAAPPGEGGGGARYAPLIDAVGRRYFAREWGLKGVTRQVGERIKRGVTEYPGVLDLRAYPVFLIVVTCGDCADSLETTKLVRRASFLPMFVQFAGLSVPAEAGAPDPEQRFRFLRTVDHLGDTHVDCAGFFEPGDPNDTDALYHGLLNELPRWLELDKVRAMLQPRVATEEGAEPGPEAALMTLPPIEAARRERSRLERERRRADRASLAALELEQAAAWPTIRTAAEADADEDDPIVRGRGDGPAKRLQVGTRPYMTDDGVAPVLPPRRPTVSFSASIEPAPPVETDDESTVETAIERLARIRARRNARKDDP